MGINETDEKEINSGGFLRHTFVVDFEGLGGRVLMSGLSTGLNI